MSNESFSKTLEQLDSYSHHVFLVFGDTQKHEQDIRAFLCDYKNITLEHNPDVFFFNSSQFGIAESRKIKQLVSRRNTQLEKKYIIISSDAITVEAQNALLKTIEDPESPTIFFILLPHGSYVLDTIESRSQIITTTNTESFENMILNYLQGSFKERIDLLDNFYLDSSEKSPKINKGQFSLFLNELQDRMAELVIKKEIDTKVFDDIQEITQYLFDRSANTKQILEYISLRIPTLASLDGPDIK